jgi:hypothetical protein
VALALFPKRMLAPNPVDAKQQLQLQFRYTLNHIALSVSLLAGNIPLLMHPHNLGNFICKAHYSIKYHFCRFACAMASSAQASGAPAYLPLAQCFRMSSIDSFPA